ncbi:hypothetical protein QQ045_013803 [Rhodiola kirilowii]
MNWTMDMLHDSFHFPNSYEPSEYDMMNDVQDDSFGNVAHEKYSTLLAEAQRPLYFGSRQTVLELILKGMQTKVECRWSDKSFNKYLEGIKDAIPPENNCPGSYRDVKKIMKNLGLDYQIIHACEYECVLYYKQHSDREYCHICHEPRYATSEGRSKVPNKIVRYFPITPRLQRLYMSPYIAEEMKWHAEQRGKDGDNDLIHPRDEEAWENFNKEFQEFAHEIRNVRIGLSTDGFNPFGVSALSHSTWPIIVMSYNLPLWMCMKKEFNILAMLISGPKSPGKCMNVFMRPLIDELNMLWNTGVGHRRWLSKDHAWRKASDKFNGQVELRARPPSLLGREILDEVLMHDFPTLSLHPSFKVRGNTEKLCWTHKSIFYELPYWKTFIQPYSLDVMHIEKNVFDNIIGTILALEGKIKDDHKARAGLKEQGRGTYKCSSLAHVEDDVHSSLLSREDNAYQEWAPSNLRQLPIDSIHIDLGFLPQVNDVREYEDDEDGYEDEEEDDCEYEEEDEYEYDNEEDDVHDHDDAELLDEKDDYSNEEDDADDDQW